MEYSLELHVSISFISPYSFLQPDFERPRSQQIFPLPVLKSCFIYTKPPFATHALVQIWDLFGITLVCTVASCDLYLTKTSVLYYRLL